MTHPEKKRKKRREPRGFLCLACLACFAVAFAFEKGLRALRVCTFRCPRCLSYRLVSGGWGALHPGLAQGFVRSFVLAGGACTLLVHFVFVSFVGVSLRLAGYLLP